MNATKWAQDMDDAELDVALDVALLVPADMATSTDDQMLTALHAELSARTAA